MSHHHAHHNHAKSNNQQNVLIALCLTFSFMLVEAIGGMISGSLALLADAGHMFTDAAALALAYTAFRLGRRQANERHSFGYMRFEVIAGLINALTLFLIVLWIGYEAYQRLSQPQPIMALPMFVVAVLGFLVNILVFWVLSRGDKEHVNIRGAMLHVLGDLLGSAAAIIAAVVIYLTGWMAIDPILSILVCLLILRSAWGLLKSSLHILLEGTPEDIQPQLVIDTLIHKISDLKNVSHVHIWQISSGQRLITLHVEPDKIELAQQVTIDAEQLLKEQFSIQHVTIAITWPKQSSACPINSK